MSYLVLARKYRPQTFSQVVGQEHVTRTLANAFAQDRVHHAFLFCGPRGVGKTTAARILGKALNCARGPTADPCGECESCTAIANGSAVDYYEMDGASNRGIDAIRELREAVRYQPAQLRKKVYVIDEVHMLTTEAFNALLKTLEEPPPHVTFVLATTEPHKLPNTILSRCQRYDFKLVPAAKLTAFLEDIFRKEGIDFERAALALIVRESGGSVRDALSLADQMISFAGDEPIAEARVAEVLGVADRALTRSLVTALAAGDAKTALEAVDAAVARGVDEVQIARAIVRYVRDLAVLQASGGAVELVEGSDEERAELASQAAALDRPRVRQLYERMLRACDELAGTRMPRLALDLALIDVAATEPVLPLGDLLDRLEELERRLGRGSFRVTGGSAAGQGGGAGEPARDGGRGAARPARPGTGGAVREAAGPAAASGSPAAGDPRAAEPHARSAPADSRRRAPVPGDGAPVPAPAASDARGAPARPASASAGAAGGPAPRGTPPADPLAEWEAVIAELEAARAMTLVAAAQQARIVSWTEDAVTVALPEGSMEAAIAQERANVSLIETVLGKRFGRRVRFRVVAGAADAPVQAKSLVEIDRERAERERAEREREAREHPLTQLVLHTFGAEIAHIKEIKTDGG
ncbi:MAG: DNA polymerase III subunit gamma/tau [Deltaproteobacteria bacterium]|nr:MAG: DNA polymerase III subunit gamma/tau [Deltaproteobacteria bacterium]